MKSTNYLRGLTEDLAEAGFTARLGVLLAIAAAAFVWGLLFGLGVFGALTFYGGVSVGLAVILGVSIR